MSFYTDEQLSMILSTMSPICVKREDDSGAGRDEAYTFANYILGPEIQFRTIEKCLRELERIGLA